MTRYAARLFSISCTGISSSFPGQGIAKRQMSGFGGMMSIRYKDGARSNVRFGSYSLPTDPARMPKRCPLLIQ